MWEPILELNKKKEKAPSWEPILDVKKKQITPEKIIEKQPLIKVSDKVNKLVEKIPLKFDIRSPGMIKLETKKILPNKQKVSDEIIPKGNIEKKARRSQTPIAEALSSSKFFKPIADKTRARDVVRELPDQIVNLSTNIAQSIARNIILGSRTLTGEKKASIKPTTRLEEIITGVEAGEDFDLADEGKDIASIFGENFANKIPREGLLVIGSISAFSDMFGGQAPKSALKQLAKEQSLDTIKILLKKEFPEISDEIVENIAPRLAQENTEQGVKNILQKGAVAEQIRREGVDNFIKEIQIDESIDEEISTIADNIRSQRKTETIDDVTESKQISQVDKLIAEGKIRVVSRDGRDVYQVKKGTIWKNTRDEDSAIKQVTEKKAPSKPKVYEPKDQEKIDQNELQLAITRENLQEHPAKPLLKYIDRKEGSFLDFRNPDYAKSNFERDRIISKNKKIMKEAERAFENDPKLMGSFDDPDTIREVIEDYKVIRQVEKGLVAEKNELKKTLKPVSTDVPSKVPQKVSKIDTTRGSGRSIEIQANQALDMLKDESVGVNVSLPKIIENTVTNVQKKVHLIDTYLTTPHFVMNKIGFGKEAKMLREAMDGYWKELPENLDTITQWSKKVSKEDNKLLFRYLDGEAVTLKPELKKVANEIREWLQEWAVRLKLPKDNTITHYITHIFDKELLAKEFDEDLAKIIADKIPGQVYDPFLLKRLGAKGYKQDTWAALDAYTKRATRKVYLDPALETIRAKAGSSLDMSNIEKSQFNYIKRYIDNINMRPSDAEEGIDNFIKSMIGYKLGGRPTTAILKFFRQATFRGMLGLNPTSALRNLSQGVNTFATLGSKYTTIGYLNLFKKGAGKELLREGVLNAGFVQDRALNATKKAIENMDKVLFAFFDRAEKINRGGAYFGAKAQALSKGKSETEAIEYAKEIVRKTQFQFDSIDTPVGMSSDIAKTLMQFQTYTTKQTEFLLQMAKKREFAGLLRYALAGTAFVYTIGQAFGMEPKELLPWYRFQTPPSLKFPVEAVKAVVDAPDKYGTDRTLKEKAEDVGKAAIGLIPGGSQMKKTIEGIKSVQEGGVFDKSGKLQFQQGQSTAEKIQSIIFGKYASKNAKDYFNRQKIKDKEQAPMKEVYDEVQSLVAEGRIEEATALTEAMTPEEYAIYKQIKTSEKAKETLLAKKEMLPIAQEVFKLVQEGKIEEATAITESMTPEEYRVYKLIKAQVEKDKEAIQGNKPEFQDGEPQTPRSIIGTVATYAKAIGTDPITAFNRIFTGQKIRYVASGAIVVERMSLKESQKIKEERGDTGDMKLDHLIPLQLGGSNDEDNLVLVPTEIWESYTPVENFIGEKLRAKEIRKKEAQDIITQFKSGDITAEEIYNRFE